MTDYVTTRRVYQATRQHNRLWAAATGARLTHFYPWLGGRRDFWGQLEHCSAERLSDMGLREELLMAFSGSLSDPTTLSWIFERIIKDGRGILEIGGANGYWASLFEAMARLLKHRLEIHSFDIAPTGLFANPYHGKYGAPRQFFPVQLGGTEQAALYPHCTLVMGWPPPGGMAAEAAETFRLAGGEYMLYFGDLRYNADDVFKKMLLRQWHLQSSWNPVRWAGFGDFFGLFHRREPSRCG